MTGAGAFKFCVATYEYMAVAGEEQESDSPGLQLCDPDKVT
jgi:hypothetical protein